MQDPAEPMSNVDASVLGATKVGAKHAFCALLCELATTRAPPEAKQQPLIAHTGTITASCLEGRP